MNQVPSKSASRTVAQTCYRRMCTATLAALLFGWTASGVRAGLNWPVKTVELNADAKTTVVDARFRFTNDGSSSVDISQVQTSCGCTTATLEQRHFDPSQSGEIVAHYTIGDHVGLQKKLILVSTNDHSPPTTLTLIIHIPELVRIQPASVTWVRGEVNAAKTITVTAAQASTPLQDVLVRSSSPFVKATVQPGSESGKYLISIIPSVSDRPLFTTLTIDCNVGAEKKTFHAFAYVQSSVPVTAVTSPGRRPVVLATSAMDTPMQSSIGNSQGNGGER